MRRIGRERGWPPMTRQQFDAARGRGGALLVGQPEEVAEKILFEHELFSNQRFLGHTSLGDLAHRDVMRSIERFGTEVAPVVRAEVARRQAPAAAGAGSA
jgi:alkanesulfonate monooxygenase SsuD/methylene tetrahydromethanopterin reductase-like flavin-dependent oxidoreductase (luciferase family)